MIIKDITISKLKAGDYRRLLPELYALGGTVENNKGHVRQDVFKHTIRVFTAYQQILGTELLPPKKRAALSCFLEKKVGKLARTEILSLAVLLHDIGKKEALLEKDGQTSCPAHEIISCSKLSSANQRLKLNSQDFVALYQLIFCHDLASDLLGLMVFKKKRAPYLGLLKELSGGFFLEQLILLWADLLGGDSLKTEPAVFQQRQQIIKSLVLGTIK